MEIDEEPADAVNTCSYESRRQCIISFSVLLLIVSIVYVATTIVYTSYTMVIEMDNEVENHVVKIIGLMNTCVNPHKLFNVDVEDSTHINIVWNDPPLTYDTMKNNMFVYGVDDWNVFSNLTIGLNRTEGCENLMIVLTP